MSDQLDIFAAIEEACTVPAVPGPTHAEIMARRAERRDRAAARLREYGERRVAAGRQVADMIPLGQPMMPDHYSYRSDVNRRAKMARNFDKGYEAIIAAERIESTRASTAISSDASDAVAQLRAKLAKAEAKHETMKKVNKVIRGWKTRPGGSGPSNGALCAELEAFGLTPATVRELLAPQFAYHGQGFPAYALTNSNGRIKGIRDRIATVEREQARRVELANSDAGPVVHGDPDGVHWLEDVEANRVCVIFPGKPEREVIELVKRWGFRWNRYECRWQRQANANGRYAAKMVLEQMPGGDRS
jgi:hypothetical protein